MAADPRPDAHSVDARPADDPEPPDAMTVGRDPHEDELDDAGIAKDEDDRRVPLALRSALRDPVA
jgi:hypothetical protein